MTIADPQLSASAAMDTFLANYGLQGLGDFAWNEIKLGIPLDQVLLDIRQTPEYKARFPAMETLGKQGRAISEQQYIDYERTAMQLTKEAGLPTGFFTRDDVTQSLLNNVALPELKSRLDLAKNAVYNAPPETLQALQDYYGLHSREGAMPGELAAYWLDPQKAVPLLQQQFLAAQEAGASSRAGFGKLTQHQAEGLAQRGVTEGQAQQGFGNLAMLQPLFDALPGENATPITRDEALLAQFGNNAQARIELERRQAERRAPFQGGGSFATSQQGVGGAGPAIQ